MAILKIVNPVTLVTDATDIKNKLVKPVAAERKVAISDTVGEIVTHYALNDPDAAGEEITVLPLAPGSRISVDNDSGSGIAAGDEIASNGDGGVKTAIATQKVFAFALEAFADGVSGMIEVISTYEAS